MAAVCGHLGLYEFSVEGIRHRTFLPGATSSWSTKPRFVLLAGAATATSSGMAGGPELDRVPTLIVDTRYL